jgi:hypothetical protein
MTKGGSRFAPLFDFDIRYSVFDIHVSLFRFLPTSQ